MKYGISFILLLFSPLFALGAIKTPQKVSTYYLPSGVAYIEELTPRPKTLFILPSGALFFWNVPRVYASEPTLKEWIALTIKTAAQKYGASEYELSEVADCESGWQANPEQAIVALGDQGRSYGLFQYFKSGTKDTFKRFQIEADMPDLERKNWQHQAELSAWAFSMGEKYKDDWSCYVRLFQ